MPFIYFICGLLALSAGGAEAPRYDGLGHPDVIAPVAVAPSFSSAQVAADAHAFMVFMRGTPIGKEEVTVRSDPTSILISGQGRLSPPIDLITKRAEIRYRADWTPESLVIEASLRGGDLTIKTTFADGEARSQGMQGGNPFSKTDKVAPQAVVLPNLFFGSYEALARRLASVAGGGELPAYIAPFGQVPVRVKSVVAEKIQTGSTVFGVRRYELVVVNPPPQGEVNVQLTADEQGHLVRLTVPSQSLDVVRDDVAASTSRTQSYSNPGDEPVTMPGSGFNIAGTITRPASASASASARAAADKSAGRPAPDAGRPVTVRNPAVVLLAGSGTNDRDGVAMGVPTLGQLAGALAHAGFLTVRYDRRGTGQTGGRAESATLTDYAEDARSVVRYLEKRKDVDPKRIAVAGHSEGAWVALLAASRDNKIKAVVSIAAPATTGAELVLAQQRSLLDQSKATDAERQSKIELQQKIHTAVMSGKGWESVPPALRKQADTPWFQSLLAYDPAKVIKDVEQPILILHGELDRQVPVSQADQLAALAKKGDSKAVEVVTVRGVNHLLVPATTGEVSEYGSLKDPTVSADVTSAIAGWLTKMFAARR